MKRALAAALLLAGCGREAPRETAGAGVGGGAGARLEAAATAAGLVADVRKQALTGAWALDTDHACVVPMPDAGGDAGAGAKGDARQSRMGVLVDYGDGQGCAASGTVRRDGERLDVRLGACRIEARLDAGRIVFPAELPETCQALCTGRASLEAFTVDQVSGSQSEAATLRTPSGRPLCS